MPNDRKPAAVEKRLRLICLPYAGGSSLAYRHWVDTHPSLEVVEVDYPGHLLRPEDELVDNMDDLVAGLWSELFVYTGEPYVLLGSSMGALVAFELARVAIAAGRPPEFLATVACAGPVRLPKAPPIRDLPDQEFLEAFSRQYGLNRSVVTDPELAEYFAPILRADMCVFEQYAVKDPAPIAIDILAVFGTRDEIALPADVKDWSRQTLGRFVARSVDSDHFLIEKVAPEVLDILASETILRDDDARLT